MAIGSGVLLPGVAENPTFPILSALAYTTGLGYRPTCDTSLFTVNGMKTAIILPPEAFCDAQNASSLFSLELTTLPQTP